MNPISNHRPLGDANACHCYVCISSKHCKVDTWFMQTLTCCFCILGARRMSKIPAKCLLEIEDSNNARLILNFFNLAFYIYDH